MSVGILEMLLGTVKGRLVHISMREPAAMWRVAERESLNNAVERNDPVLQTK
jgi:hypothetical protein